MTTGPIVPDTNVLLRARRDPEARARFARFVRRRGSALALVAPVEMELRAGVRTPASAQVTEQLMAAMARDRRRLVPSAAAFAESGRVLAALGSREGLDVSAARGSFITDVLIAATCREHGALLVTANADDFVRIQRHLRGFRFVTEWPS